MIIGMMDSMMTQMSSYSFADDPKKDYWADPKKDYWAGPFDPEFLFDFVHFMLRTQEAVRPWELYSTIGLRTTLGVIPYTSFGV